MAAWVEELPPMPPRPRDGHKGTFGRVLVVGGSEGMAGAAALAGMAALKSGAGLVTVACPKAVQPTVAGFHPCLMTKGFEAIETAKFAEWCAAADVVAIGPGIGHEPWAKELVRSLLGSVAKPVVLDADGLNAIADDVEAVLAARPGPTVLTPHPGEMARLTKLPIEQVQAQRDLIADQFATRNNCCLILKGQGSVVADPRYIARNSTGNPGMATGGTGDVLTGIVAALWHVVGDPWGAARLAAHLHGRAGDLAAWDLGEASLTAQDVLNYLPRAFLEVTPRP